MITFKMCLIQHSYSISLHNTYMRAHIKSVPTVTKNHSRPWLRTLHLPAASTSYGRFWSHCWMHEKLHGKSIFFIKKSKKIQFNESKFLADKDCLHRETSNFTFAKSIYDVYVLGEDRQCLILLLFFRIWFTQYAS